MQPSKCHLGGISHLQIDIDRDGDSLAHTKFTQLRTQDSDSLAHTKVSQLYTQSLRGMGWGSLTTLFFLLSSKHRHCSFMISYRWGAVGWGNNVHVPAHTQAQQPYLSCCPEDTGTALSWSVTGGVRWGGVITFMFLRTHRHSNLIFLAVQKTQALLFHDQLPVGWGGVIIPNIWKNFKFSKPPTRHVMLVGYIIYTYIKLNIQPCWTSSNWYLDLTTNNRHSWPANLMEQILLQPVEVEWIFGWIYCTNVWQVEGPGATASSTSIFPWKIHCETQYSSWTPSYKWQRV